MDYTIICAKSQEEILEILSHNVTSREKDLDEGRLIQERKKRGAFTRLKKIYYILFCSFSLRMSKHLFSSTPIKVTLQEAE